MFNLKSLAQVQGQLDKVRSQRQTDVSGFLDAGYALIGDAEASQFRNPERLADAFDQFLDAIRNQRTNPEGYNGAGYVLLLLGELEQARSYFLEALKFQADNADAKTYLQYILERQKSGPLAEELDSEELAEIDNFDLLYERTAQMIVAAVRQAMDTPLPAPSSRPGQIASLQQQAQKFSELCYQIESQLKRLEAEIETAELEMKLHPLKAVLKRHENLLSVSQRFQDLSMRMQGLNDKVKALLDALEAGEQSDYSAELEHILDLCDLFADEIDALENQRQPTEELEVVYHKLIQAVESLQDKLEDLA